MSCLIKVKECMATLNKSGFSLLKNAMFAMT